MAASLGQTSADLRHLGSFLQLLQPGVIYEELEDLPAFR